MGSAISWVSLGLHDGWRTGKRVPVESYAVGRSWSRSLDCYASIVIWSGREVAGRPRGLR